MATSHTKVLSIVLAGGEGKRLMPLTTDRAKPAVPFGGTYRLIDFVLSNLANSGLTRIAVLTQYKSHSLDRHISQAWRMSTMLGNYVTPVPAQQRMGKHWFRGSADAIYQSLNLLDDERPDYVVITGADNIYRMDVSQMLEAHVESGLNCTVAGIRVPRKDASAFGIIDAAQDNKINSFLEKPADPPGLPAPGVYARSNAADVPAVSGETLGPVEESVPRVLRVRGLERSIGEVDREVAQALALARSDGQGDSPFGAVGPADVGRIAPAPLGDAAAASARRSSRRVAPARRR